MTPGIEHHAFCECLAPSGHHDAVVLVLGVHICHREVKFQSSQAEFVQPRIQRVGPIVTKTTIAPAEIDEVVS